MRRSFYEMLGIENDANLEEIDAAFEKETLRLNSGALRGTSEAVLARTLMREGYEILADPEKRARYDAKLEAEKAGVKLLFFSDNHVSTRRLSGGVMVAILLAASGGFVAYRQISAKMDEVHGEHLQAVAQKVEERSKVITVDMTTPESLVQPAAVGMGR